MKIIYFNSYYAPDFGGGAEVTLQQQVEAMRDHGNDVMVVCLGREHGIVHDVINGIPVVRIGMRNMYFALENKSSTRSPLEKLRWHIKDQNNIELAEYVTNVVRQFNPDVASCHNLAGLSISIWAMLSKLNIPIAQVLHDQYLLCPRTTMVRKDKLCTTQCLDCRLLRAKHAKASRSVNCLIGVSKYIVDKFIDNDYFVNSSKFVINNVRRPNMWGSSRMSRPLLDSSFVFGFIGSITRIKGIELLLESFRSSEFPSNVKLVVAGSGADLYVAELKNRYSDSHIEWLGHTSPLDFFSRIDVLVTPSIWNDTFPGVVFEAFGFGVPVIGSNRGGIPEMIDNGFNGLIFNADSPSELMAHMNRVLSDRPLTSKLADGAYASAAKYQDVDAWVSKYTEAYTVATKPM